MFKPLHSYNDEFFIFDSKPKIKLYILKNNYIDDFELNDFEYIIAKSLLNNFYLDREDVENNIKNKLSKLNFNKKQNKIITNMRHIDNNNFYHDKVKKKLVSNVFELNQTGGGLLWYLNKLIKGGSDTSIFFKFLYVTYNSILIILDIILDIALILPRFQLLNISQIIINVTNLIFAILNLDWFGIAAALLAFIPNFGDILSSVGGLGIHLYNLINYLFVSKGNKIVKNLKTASPKKNNYSNPSSESFESSSNNSESSSNNSESSSNNSESSSNNSESSSNNSESSSNNSESSFDNTNISKININIPNKKEIKLCKFGKKFILPSGLKYDKIFYDKIKNL